MQENKAKAAAKKKAPAKDKLSKATKSTPAQAKTKKQPVKKTAAKAKKETSKAGKTKIKEEKTVFSKADLEAIVESLKEQKADILESLEMKKKLDMESGSGGDEIDIASRHLNNEMLYELSSNDMILVRDIDAALTKIKKGTYGICEHCNKPIEMKRLKFMPYVRYCVACQNGSELSLKNLE